MSQPEFYGPYSVPEWAEYYLAYGEDESLDDEDSSTLEGWVKSIAKRMEEDGFTLSHFDEVGDSETYFALHPAFGLASTCRDYLAVGFKKMK
jgi:hypothetical protein